MKHKLLTLFILLVPLSICWADDQRPNVVPGISLPASVTGDPDDWIVIKATTSGKTVKWLSLTPGLKLFPPDELVNKTHAVVIAPRPGVYTLVAWTAVDGEPTDAAYCLITVGTPAPPTPPDPPKPPVPPPDPEPTDAWYLPIKVAWARETAQDKAMAGTLAGVYRAAAANVADKNKYVVLQDFLAVLKTATHSGPLATALPNVKAAAGPLLNVAIPPLPNMPLDSATRQNIAAAMTRLAAILEYLERKGR